MVFTNVLSRDTAAKAEVSPYIMRGTELESKRVGQSVDDSRRERRPDNSDESVAYIAEQDAGPAPGYERERVRVVPPSYDPRWSEQIMQQPPQGSPEQYEGEDYLRARDSSVQLSSEGRQSMDEKAKRQSSTPSASRQSSALTTDLALSEKRRHSSRTSEMDDRRASDSPSTIRRHKSTDKPPLILAEMERAMSSEANTPSTLPDRKLSDNTDDVEHPGGLQRKSSTYKSPIVLQSMFRVSEERLGVQEELARIDPLDAGGQLPTPPPGPEKH